VSRGLEVFAALRHPAEPRFLFLRSDRAWRLPRVVVRDGWTANAAVIVPALERRLGTTPWVLRALREEQDEGTKRAEAVLELALRDPDWQPPAHGRWVGRGALDGLRLRDEHQREHLAATLDGLEGEIPAARPPWARPGWLEEVEGWVEREAARLGRRMVGIDQIKHWSISSVLCIRTDGPDLYFKVSARLPLFVAEEAVTASLAERFPGHVPAPVAVDAARGWMLLPAFGDLLDWHPSLELHQELFRRFAGLQRRTVELTAALLDDGCLDRRLDVLAAQIEPLLADPVATRRLTSDEAAELVRLAPRLQEACSRLADCGVPSTLVHGDLHPGNVAQIDGELAYFDWTDACIAHPFIDLHSLQWERDETRRAALLDAYLGAWAGVAAPERLREAVALAAVVTPLHHAVSYSRIVGALEEGARFELDATHVFLREVLARARDWPDG
jgi:hypothetical protein